MSSIALDFTQGIFSYPQWVCWHLVDGRKVPFDPATGHPIDVHDRKNWRTHWDAIATGHPIGFVLTDADPWFCIDLDSCWTSGGWTAEARAICDLFQGAPGEVSQSGRGLHIWGRCEKAKLADRRNKFGKIPGADRGNWIEFYIDKRFIAMGRGSFDPNCRWDRDWTDTLTHLVPKREVVDGSIASLVDQAAPEYTGPADDDDLIDLMFRGRGSTAVQFRERASVQQLWNADQSVLAAVFPSPGQRDVYDRSQADAALMMHLAFWTGKNSARMDRLFRRSGLMRRKYADRPDTYALPTISGAIANCRNVYDRDHRRQAQIDEMRKIGADPDELSLPTVLTLDDMIRDLVYVGGSGAVVHVPTMRVRKKQDALGEYAASKHTYETGDFDAAGNAKTKTVPALVQWIGNSSRRTVDVLTWAPDRPRFCNPPEGSDAGDRGLNTWRDLKVLPAPPDWREWIIPFERHVAYLAPKLDERRRFLEWLAHILQRPGQLPHTCYLMITETTGIGRNWLAAVLTRVLRGHVAAGVSISEVLDGSFNGRLSRKLLATVDETREGMTERRYERGQRLKSLITEEFRHINPKYGVQSVEQNCCRWLMFSNHFDALPIDNNDRRVIVIENPTERADPQWYAHIYSMLDRPEFIASVQHFLLTLDISNFKSGEHAPMNSGKQKALESMMSDADRLASQFREEWPGDLAGRRNLQQFIADTMGSPPNSNHLTHAIVRAGMINAGKRIKHNGRSESVIIVRNLTVEQIEASDPAELSRRINQAATTFIMGIPGSPSSPSSRV